VKVEVKVIERVENEDLTGWLRAAEKEDADVMTLMLAYLTRKYRQGVIIADTMLAFDDLPAIMPAATSDAAGRFRLTGIGRERLVWLSIQGAGIETAWQVWARTRPGPTLVVPKIRLRDSERYTYYGATFEHVARPSRPIVGTVRDKDTGKPLAGVTIKSYKLSGNPAHDPGFFINTTSDAAGHYRLQGMPIGKDNALLAEPTKAQPYLPSKQRADTTVGKDLLRLDFALKRGVWIRGRITDAQTGASVPGCIVNYFVFRDNPHWKSAPGFEDERQYFSSRADQDGRYAVVGLPGRGIVTVRAWGDERARYRMRAGLESIPELRNEGEPFDRVAPSPLYTQWMHALAKVDPADGIESLQHDFQLDRGQTLTGTVLDSAGRPLAGAHYSGREKEPGWNLLGSDTFTVNCYQANDKPRTLLFVHQGRKLAGSLTVEGPQTAPLRVQLQPWGAITGRVVDAHGKPASGVGLVDTTLPEFLFGKHLHEEIGVAYYRIGGDGRFFIEGMTPGVKYSLMAEWDGRIGEHRHFGPMVSDLPGGTRRLKGSLLVLNVAVASGETKDLGDLHLGRMPWQQRPASPAPAKKAPPKAAASAAGAPATTAAVAGKKQESPPQKEQVIWERPRGNCSISGTVVSATTGKHVAGAEMLLGCERPNSAIGISAASDGTFNFKDIPTGPFWLKSLSTKGYQDASYNPDDKPGQFPEFTLADGEHRSGVVLKLQEACRISGKIMDEKGKVPEDAGRMGVLAWFQRDGSQEYDWKGNCIDAEDGSYTIDGLSGKPVYLMAINWLAAKEGNAWPPIYYPGTFSRSDAKQITFDKSRSVEHVDIRLRKTGGLILEGTVRDEAGKPVPEAFVVVYRRDMSVDFVTAYTDARGRYQIQGLGDGKFLVHVDAVHRGLVRTRTPVDLDNTSKRTLLNFTLRRGATISGKLVGENGRDWQVVGPSDGSANVDVGNKGGGFLLTDVDFRNKYRPKNANGLAGGWFYLGSGDYASGEMSFPTKSTFIVQGMMPGNTTFHFSEPIAKILHDGQDVQDSGIDTEPGQDIKDVTIVVGKQ
jgi:protocatechuate 3,4-dioxygenase beta subunit